MENLLDKYKPSKLSDVLGDKMQIQKIDKFLKQFTRKNKQPNKIIYPNLIIKGRNGIGKTLIVDIVIKENGMEKICADLSNIVVTRKNKRKKKTEKEINTTNRTINTYYKSLKSNKNLLSNAEFSEKKITLVFDNVNNISNPKQKEAIKAIIKTNNKLKEFPIIIIASTNHSRIVNELKKMVTFYIKRTTNDGKKINRKIINEIYLNPPEYYEIEKFVKKICMNENINFSRTKKDEDDIFVELINHSQFDIRRLVNILEELKLIFLNSEITLPKFKQFCETSKTKDIDPGIYEATYLLLNKYTNINDALMLYGEERATIPLMFHENYPLNIRYQYPNLSVDEQIDMIYNISKSISESDKVDGIIYSNQCWNLQSVHGFYSCVLPSYCINEPSGKLLKPEKHLYNYTQDYNKTSIKKINNKVIKKAQENKFFKKVSVYDFLYISSILKTLLEKEDFEKMAELMKPYCLKLKEIESIIKIDKIIKQKTSLSSKQKAILKKLLGVKE